MAALWKGSITAKHKCCWTCSCNHSERNLPGDLFCVAYRSVPLSRRKRKNSKILFGEQRLAELSCIRSDVAEHLKTAFKGAVRWVVTQIMLYQICLCGATLSHSSFHVSSRDSALIPETAAWGHFKSSCWMWYWSSGDMHTRLVPAMAKMGSFWQAAGQANRNGQNHCCQIYSGS